MQSSSSSKSCYTDPEDNQYIICKETINQNGNQTTNTSRLPIQEYQNQFNFGGMGMMPEFGSIFRGLIGMDNERERI